MSLLFIAGFWFSISRGLETLVTFDVPIEYQNRDPNMEIVHASVNSVRLNLSGSGTLVKSIRPDQVRVRLDLSNSAAGPEHFMRSPASNISLPPGIVLKEVAPQNVVGGPGCHGEKGAARPDRLGRPAAGEHRPGGGRGRARSGSKSSAASACWRASRPSTRKRCPSTGSGNVGVLEAGLAIQPASLKVAPGSSDKVLIKYLTRRRE
ncbi:MAG: hypothetical protein MZV70_56250 [Desulfobacterales bacterium]|nr:hypothetical protein [Desulfobacterales bacterium]